MHISAKRFDAVLLGGANETFVGIDPAVSSTKAVDTEHRTSVQLFVHAFLAHG